MGAQLDFIKLEISRNLSLARGHHVIEEAESRNMSVATSSIPHRKPSAGRAGCSGSLYRKLVEGRAGNQRCKKKDRTQGTLLALIRRTAWADAGSSRLGVEACNMSCPPPGLLGKGAPAQSGEESSRLVRSRSGRHSLAWLRRSGRPVLAACVHHDILC